MKLYDCWFKSNLPHHASLLRVRGGEVAKFYNRQVTFLPSTGERKRLLNGARNSQVLPEKDSSLVEHRYAKPKVQVQILLFLTLQGQVTFLVPFKSRYLGWIKTTALDRFENSQVLSEYSLMVKTLAS